MARSSDSTTCATACSRGNNGNILESLTKEVDAQIDALIKVGEIGGALGRSADSEDLPITTPRDTGGENVKIARAELDKLSRSTTQRSPGAITYFFATGYVLGLEGRSSSDGTHWDRFGGGEGFPAGYPTTDRLLNKGEV